MKITTLKQLGAFIRDQRRQRGWTQQQLADASGTLQSWLSGVEKGKGNPEFAKIMAVLRVLEITLDLKQLSVENPAGSSTATESDTGTVKNTATGQPVQPSLATLRRQFQKDSTK